MAISDIDLKPTAEMASNAERGLALREKHGKGGTAVGVARARDIKNRANLSPETVKRMHSFFSRHEGNQKGGEDDAGYIAWLLWGGDAGKSWSARKAEQIDKATSARFSHDIALPKVKRRLNIDEATAALAQMGYRIGNVRYDPAAGSVYRVTQPNGTTVDMTAAKLADFIYQKANHMMNAKKARMSQVSQMLDMLESQANDQPDLAKKNIQKMVDHVAHEGTSEEFKRLMRIAERLGLRGLMSRDGAKAKFGLVEIEAVQKRMRGIQAKIKAAEQALRDETKQGNFRNGASTCDSIANLYKEMKSAYLAYEDAFRSSRTGAKAKFAWTQQDTQIYQIMLQKALDLEKKVDEAVSTRWRPGSSAERSRELQNLQHYTVPSIVELLRGAWLKVDRQMLSDAILKYNKTESKLRALMSRDGAKAKFEKSDDYARILMQPVNSANCGRMTKTADDAISWAKSIGDEDLLELAEVVRNSCRRLRARGN